MAIGGTLTDTPFRSKAQAFMLGIQIALARFVLDFVGKIWYIFSVFRRGFQPPATLLVSPTPR